MVPGQAHPRVVEGRESVHVERPADGVAVVVLNRPARLNAMDEAMFGELACALDAVGRDETVRVVVLTGAGQGFCAGADLDASGPPSDISGAEAWMRGVHRGPLALAELPQPTIAAINGPAAGGGLGLALACDIRIAAPTAVFTAPFVRIGLGPDFGLSRLLPSTIGMALALELLLTARTVLAEEALTIGLVSHIVDDPLATSIALAQQISAVPPAVVQRIKTLLHDAAGADHRTVLTKLEPTAQAAGIADPAFAERTAAWSAAKGDKRSA